MVALLLALLVGWAEPGPDVPHMVWADRLLREIRPGDNAYGSRPTLLEWQGVDGALISRNRTVCSSFLTRLLRRAYGLDGGTIRRWLGAAAPTAADYHRAIARGDRFLPIGQIEALRRGDLMAIDYRRRAAAEEPSGSSTGHVMLVAGQPEPLQGRRPAKGQRFYSLLVLDSSRSGHGPLDTRVLSQGRRGAGGVGQGRIALLVDSQGRILAYSWSTLAQSRLIPQRLHSLLVGRLCLERCGALESRRLNGHRVGDHKANQHGKDQGHHPATHTLDPVQNTVVGIGHHRNDNK
jgi:hypothetical protein